MFCVCVCVIYVNSFIQKTDVGKGMRRERGRERNKDKVRKVRARTGGNVKWRKKNMKLF